MKTVKKQETINILPIDKLGVDIDIEGDINQLGKDIESKINTLNITGNLTMEGNLTVTNMNMTIDNDKMKEIIENYLKNKKSKWQFWK